VKFFSVLIFCFILGGNVYAAPDISAERACLMIQETGEIIYEYKRAAGGARKEEFI